MMNFAVSKVFFIFVFSKCMVKNSVIATSSAYYINNIYIKRRKNVVSKPEML